MDDHAFIQFGLVLNDANNASAMQYYQDPMQTLISHVPECALFSS
jgi:hypothetical protein